MVCWSGPAMNSTATTSSNEVTKANKAPEMTPGRIKGMITLKNVVRGLAPRLAEARISDWSKPDSVAVTVMITKGMPSVAWARMMPRNVLARQPLAERNGDNSQPRPVSGDRQALE